MAANNRLWKAECIRGELLKLDIRVSKRTIQKYMKQVRPKRARGQTWKTFLRNHAAEMWVCDFLQVTDLFFRPLFAFLLVELKSPKVIHVNVTRSPTDSWVAQQLREATPYGQASKYLIRDNDKKFGPSFARVTITSGIKVLRTPYRTPQAHAVCERFLGSVRRECLDHFLIFHEKHLSRLLKAYILSFNQVRPHHGLQQRIPEPPILSAFSLNPPSWLRSVGLRGLFATQRWLSRQAAVYRSISVSIRNRFWIRTQAYEGWTPLSSLSWVLQGCQVSFWTFDISAIPMISV